MNKRFRSMTMILSTVACFGLAGCEKKEGPAERAGKVLDNAAEKTGQEIQKIGEQIQDAARDAKK